MKDLRVYYVTDDGEEAIYEVFDFFLESLAEFLGMKFVGSGVEIGKKIRDIHYIKKRKKK